MPNQYYPYKLEFADTISRDKTLAFAVLTGPYGIWGALTTITAMKKDSGYIFIITAESHGDVDFKGTAIISALEFSALIDSLDKVANDMLLETGTKIYIDSVELNGCINDNYKILDEFKKDSTGKKVIVYDEEDYKMEIGIQYLDYITPEEINSTCLNSQIGCILVNNIRNDVVTFPHLDSKTKVSKFTEKIHKIFNEIKWEKVY